MADEVKENAIDYIVDLLVSNSKRAKNLEKLANKTYQTGKNGKSAYEYALDGGFEGTEAQFIAALNREYIHEPFTFELDDGTTVTKEILIYAGA